MALQMRWCRLEAARLIQQSVLRHLVPVASVLVSAAWNQVMLRQRIRVNEASFPDDEEPWFETESRELDYEPAMRGKRASSQAWMSASTCSLPRSFRGSWKYPP